MAKNVPDSTHTAEQAAGPPTTIGLIFRDLDRPGRTLYLLAILGLTPAGIGRLGHTSQIVDFLVSMWGAAVSRSNISALGCSKVPRWRCGAGDLMSPRPLVGGAKKRLLSRVSGSLAQRQRQEAQILDRGTLLCGTDGCANGKLLHDPVHPPRLAATSSLLLPRSFASQSRNHSQCWSTRSGIPMFARSEPPDRLNSAPWSLAGLLA